MKPPLFSYRLPETLDEALALLEEHGDEAKPLAGGQSLVPLLNFRLARPSILVDLNELADLATIRPINGSTAVGAMVRHRAAGRSDLLRERVPLATEAVPLIGHEAIRTRGTIGGSLSHADPAAELPAVALAMDAELVVRSAARGERTIPAEQFFQGYFTTALEPDELLIEVQFPGLPAGSGVRFEEAARRDGDFAMAGVAAALHVDGATIDDARLALIGVSDTPRRARDAEAVLVGSAPSAELFAEAAATAVRDLTPPSDLHGSSAYRLHVSETLVRRALEAAAGGEK